MRSESLYFKTIYNLSSIYPNLQPAHEMLHHAESFSVAGFGGEITISEDQRELTLQYSKPWAEFSLRRLEFFPGKKYCCFIRLPSAVWMCPMESTMGCC